MTARIWLFVLLVLFTAEASTAQSAAAIANHLEFTGSDSYVKLRSKGYEVVAEKEFCHITEGSSDKFFFIAAKSERGLALFAYERSISGFELLSRSSDLPGEELCSFEQIMLGNRHGIFFKVLDDSPDEAIFHVSIFLVNSFGFYPVLSTSWEQEYTEAQAGRQAVDVLDLGRMSLGLTFEPSEQVDQWPIAVLRYQPKILELRYQKGNKQTKVIVGCQTKVFAHSLMGFKPIFKGFHDYLLPLKNLRISADDKIAGSVLQTLVDGKLDDAWPLSKSEIKIKISWEQPSPVRAVRVVACRGDARQIQGFDLRFSDGPPIRIDRTKPDEVDERLVGFEDFNSAHGGVQTLLFVRKPVVSKSLSLQIYTSGSSAERFCLSEITPFSSMLDQKRAQMDP